MKVKIKSVILQSKIAFDTLKLQIEVASKDNKNNKNKNKNNKPILRPAILAGKY